MLNSVTIFVCMGIGARGNLERLGLQAQQAQDLDVRSVNEKWGCVSYCIGSNWTYPGSLGNSDRENSSISNVTASPPR